MSFNLVKRKIIVDDLFNCNDLSNFIATITQILPYKGIEMSRFYTCNLGGVIFLTKFCFYRKSAPEIYGKLSKNVVPHADAEINILQILREKIIDRNLTPCILELVYAKICTGLDKITPTEKICEQLMLDDRYAVPENDVEFQLCGYIDLVNAGLAHNKVAFLVLEKCDMTLSDYLHKTTSNPIGFAIFKSILFQIIYTIYVINKLYPKFRHYDLHTDNIMLKFDNNFKFKPTKPKFNIYTIGGEKYSIPFFGIIPKIIDFGFSALPEEGIISNATEDRMQMYYRSQNDILILFHHIHLDLSRSGGDKFGKIDKLLQQLEPNRTYVQYYTEYIRKVEDELPTYEEMINNIVWSEYKKHDTPIDQIYNEYTPL